jgi:photosystem II stability/assembly factor-like uncharacterized protein
MKTTKKLSVLALIFGLLIPATGLCGNETEVLPGWYYQTPTNAKIDDIFMAVEALNETVLYFGGIRIDMSSGFPMISALAFRSQNAGTLAQNISGSLNSGGMLGGKMCTMTDLKVFRQNSQTLPVLWASCGAYLGFSPDGGAFKETFDAPIITGEERDQFTSIHLFNGSKGIVCTASGNIYLFELSEDGKTVTFTPTEIANTAIPATESSGTVKPGIAAMYWLDSKTGWAVATDTEDREIDDGQGMSDTQTFYHQTRVFKTTDGGNAWVLQGPISLSETEDPVHETGFNEKKYPLYFEGGWLPRHIQFVDESTGFLALVAWDNSKQLTVVAKILKTEDGGKTWADLAVNMQIGTIKGIFTQPMFFSEIGGMYFWKDNDGTIKGHVVGSSFMTEGASTGSGNPPKYYYITTLDTFDGGLTWVKKPDLGDVTFDMMGGAPANTPRALAATFLSPYAGFAVGDKGTVFRFTFKCTKQSDCDFGFYCNRDELKCLSCAEVDTYQGSIDKCADWTPPPEPDPELITDRDATTTGDSNVNYPDGTTGMDLNGFDPGAKSGGCSTGYADQSAAAVLALIFMTSVIFVTRRCRKPTKL